MKDSTSPLINRCGRHREMTVARREFTRRAQHLPSLELLSPTRLALEVELDYGLAWALAV